MTWFLKLAGNRGGKAVHGHCLPRRCLLSIAVLKAGIRQERRARVLRKVTRVFRSNTSFFKSIAVHSMQRPEVRQSLSRAKLNVSHEYRPRSLQVELMLSGQKQGWALMLSSKAMGYCRAGTVRRKIQDRNNGTATSCPPTELDDTLRA